MKQRAAKLVRYCRQGSPVVSSLSFGLVVLSLTRTVKLWLNIKGMWTERRFLQTFATEKKTLGFSYSELSFQDHSFNIKCPKRKKKSLSFTHLFLSQLRYSHEIVNDANKSEKLFWERRYFKDRWAAYWNVNIYPIWWGWSKRDAGNALVWLLSGTWLTLHQWAFKNR